jgi:hypothetical protein
MVDLLDGKREVLSAHCSRNSSLVFYLALPSLGRPVAEELVQEVFLATWLSATSSTRHCDSRSHFRLDFGAQHGTFPQG